MARESLGYMQLQWTCPNCNSENPGLQKICTKCGSPQPENVTFHHPEEEVLIKDEKELQQAKAGPDVHCPYCGARNPAGTAICVQCGGDLKEGIKRTSGSVIGSFKPGPVEQQACPNCGSPNPATQLTCSKCGGSLKPTQKPAAPPVKKAFPIWIFIIIAALALGTCICLGSRLLKTDETSAKVQSVRWEQSVVIEQYGPVKKEDWKEEIPSSAVLGACEERYHHTQSEPVDNAEKVCGTPYSVDLGNGTSEIVQDCEYRVSEDYCSYTIDEWAPVDVLTQKGDNLLLSVPQPSLKNGQRLGERKQVFVIYFGDSGKIYEFTTTDSDLFQQCQVGSEWVLNINGFGEITSIEPAK